eukprot:6194220-Pyramimonas_sp.AAC.1
MPRLRCTQTGSATLRSSRLRKKRKTASLRCPQAAHGAPAAGGHTGLRPKLHANGKAPSCPPTD